MKRQYTIVEGVKLTEKQIALLTFIAQGYKVKQIAQLLGRPQNAILTELYRLYRRLGVAASQDKQPYVLAAFFAWRNRKKLNIEPQALKRALSIPSEAG
jgi:DNA-binding NarL/FixJ family response regulator